MTDLECPSCWQAGLSRFGAGKRAAEQHFGLMMRKGPVLLGFGGARARRLGGYALLGNGQPTLQGAKIVAALASLTAPALARNSDVKNSDVKTPSEHRLRRPAARPLAEVSAVFSRGRGG